MNNPPFISIAIASYNYATYLRRGFEAIEKQSFKDIEVVYLDDASTDNSIKVIREIMEEHHDISIRLLQNKKNQGLLYTKSRLIQECKGVYLMLCDADDWMADECLEVLARIAQKENADRVISEVYDVDFKGKILQVQDIPQRPSKWLWNLHHGCLYKRSILIDNNIRINYEPDDVYMITMFNQYARKICWVKKPLYYWYVHDGSAGRKIIKKPASDVIEKFEKSINYIDDVIQKVPEDSTQLELLIIKLYFLQIYHVARNFSLRKKILFYKEIKQVLLRYHPHYLSNRYLIYKKEIPMRQYATRIIFFSTFLEKIHLFIAAIVLYHILGRIIYFDQ